MARFFNEASNSSGNSFNNGSAFNGNNSNDMSSFVSAADTSNNYVSSDNVSPDNKQVQNFEEVEQLEDYSQSEIDNSVQDSGSTFNNYQEEFVDADMTSDRSVDRQSALENQSPDYGIAADEVLEEESAEPLEFKEETNPVSEVSGEMVKIEDSSMFANVETSYMDDNTYKGVDNTGRVGEEIQNPVYDGAFEKNDINVSGNIIAVLLVLFEVLLSPGKSIAKNTQKYVNGKKEFKVFVNIVIYELLFSLIGRVVAGCFVDKMMYGDYKKVLDFSNVLALNYVNILISSLVVIFGFVLLMAIFNYASSFFSNKGLSFGAYLLVAALAFFPLILTINALAPVLSVMSLYIAIGALLVAFLFSFMIYVNALWNIMEFKSDNGKIFYTMIGFVMVSIVGVILIFLFCEDYVNAIKAIFK